MPLFDAATLTRLVSELRKSVDRLRRLGGLAQSSFLNDPDKVASAKYHFIVAIEACIDMCNHVISRNGYRVPEDYGDTFVVIGEAGAWDSEFSKNLTAMAKFRNRLVHLYREIDDEQIYSILALRIDDFKKFLNEFGKFLGWEN